MSSPSLSVSNLNAYIYCDVLCYSLRPVTNTVLTGALVIVSDIGLRINLSIKNLLPDLHIVRISYLSLALNETLNQCFRFDALESKCLSVEKF